MAAKGLTDHTLRAVQLGGLKGYKVHENLSYNILQYADVTILMDEGSWVNLWMVLIIM